MYESTPWKKHKNNYLRLVHYKNLLGSNVNVRIVEHKTPDVVSHDVICDDGYGNKATTKYNIPDLKEAKLKADEMLRAAYEKYGYKDVVGAQFLQGSGDYADNVEFADVSEEEFNGRISGVTQALNVDPKKLKELLKNKLKSHDGENFIYETSNNEEVELYANGQSSNISFDTFRTLNRESDGRAIASDLVAAISEARKWLENQVESV